jgi:hypothetical protein
MIFVYQLILYSKYKHREEFKTEIRAEQMGEFVHDSRSMNDLTNIKYPIVRSEISLLKMDNIILTLIDKYAFSKTQLTHNFEEDVYINDYIKTDNNSVKLKYKKFESYKFIKNWLLETISNEAQGSLYRINYVDPTRFKFMFDKVLNYSIDYDNNLERFKFNGTIYRENKEHNFFIYFDIIFDYKHINYYINDIKIHGMNIEQHIMFASLLNKDKYDKKGIHLSLSKDNPGYVSDKYINEYRTTTNDFVLKDQTERRQVEKRLTPNGYCFFKDARDKDNCISYTPKGGVGIWDTQCSYDEDCPFFKRNSNYPNKRGGCNNGFCEMPVNINLLGYKEYDESSANRAICHNCKFKKGCNGIECSQCCEDQKDTRLYPDLTSPDYAYPNDFTSRIKHKAYFEQKNMAPNYLLI